MKSLFYLLLFIIIISCTTDKEVYWCGDHPCINKNEREAYFKKTMIVEIKEIKTTSKNNSEVEQIMRQAGVEEKYRTTNEKDLTKEIKLEEKRRIKKEKNDIKQAKLEQKRRIKEEKKAIKQAKLEQKRRIKEEKKLAKQIERDEKKMTKDEKKLVKQIERDEKKMTKDEKKLAKQIKREKNKIIKKEKKKFKRNADVNPNLENISTGSNNFKKLVEKITRENAFKSYPDINDIPN